MTVDPYLAIAVASPLIIPLLFAVIEYFKARPQEKVTNTPLSDAKTKEFRRIESMSSLFFVLLTLLLTWPCWKLLNALGNHLDKTRSVEFLFSIQWLYWVFPAFFGAMLIAGLFVNLVLEIYLGKRSNLYTSFSKKNTRRYVQQ